MINFYHLQWGQRRKRLNHIATTYPEVEKDVNFISGMVLLKMAAAFPVWVIILPFWVVSSTLVLLIGLMALLFEKLHEWSLVGSQPITELFLHFFYRGFNTPFDKKIEAANERIERALHGKE